jgi:hypothetical protein
MTTALVRVTAPHFCAGLILDIGGKGVGETRVIEAAPILRWTHRKPWREALAWMREKGWTVEVSLP